MFFEDKEFVAKTIKSYRLKNNLTQAQLAEKIDISESHMSKLENATYSPSITTFFKIVDTLNIDLEVFDFSNTTLNNPVREQLFKIINSSSETKNKLYLDVLLSLNKFIQDK